MDIKLLLSIKAIGHTTSHDIEFFNSEQHTAETEKQLTYCLKDAISLLRSSCRGLHIVLSVDVEDPVRVSNSIHKHLRFGGAIVQDQKLSKRESQVLDLIRQGFTNKKISDKLFISFETVRTHRKNILVKTGASNTAALVSFSHQSVL